MKGVLFIFSVLLITHSSCSVNLNIESYFKGECLTEMESKFHKTLPGCNHTIEIYKMYKAISVNFYPDDFMAAHQVFVTFNYQ